MKFIKKSILTVTTGYILQQCNCVTIYPHGLAADLEKTFPGTCPYYLRKGVSTSKTIPMERKLNVAKKEDRSEPGTVMILSDEGHPHIVNMFAQYSPGKVQPANKIWWQLVLADGDSVYENQVPDQSIDREKYFATCLDTIFEYFEGTNDTIKIAVPYMIGCGLAGGDWNHYKKMLEDFEVKMLTAGMDLDMTVYIPE